MALMCKLLSLLLFKNNQEHSVSEYYCGQPLTTWLKFILSHKLNTKPTNGESNLTKQTFIKVIN